MSPLLIKRLKDIHTMRELIDLKSKNCCYLKLLKHKKMCSYGITEDKPYYGGSH